MKLNTDKKLDLREVLKDLDRYRPKRKGWTWRSKSKDQQVGPENLVPPTSIAAAGPRGVQVL